ncbi:purine and uridine phosphorylase [Apiospora sp. TS-2023a]
MDTTRLPFRIAILCALKEEYAAICYQLDRNLHDEGYDPIKHPNDPNTYTTGYLNRHLVIVTRIQRTGKAAAAQTAAHLTATYDNIKLCIVMGICAGMPKDIDGSDIILGDVIVGTHVYNSDYGRLTDAGLERYSDDTQQLARLQPAIQALVNHCDNPYEASRIEKAVNAAVKRQFNEVLDESFQYPGAHKDQLFQPSRPHRHWKEDRKCTCGADGAKSPCQSAILESCSALGCAESDEALVTRDRLNQIEDTSPASSVLPPRVKLHFGRIASADHVLRSSIERNERSGRDKVIGFEMEAAGVWDALPTLVVKGVSDYADAHKNKGFQKYAAVTSAAAVYSILDHWHTTWSFETPNMATPRSEIERGLQQIINSSDDSLLKSKAESIPRIDASAKCQLVVDWIGSHTKHWCMILQNVGDGSSVNDHFKDLLSAAYGSLMITSSDKTIAKTLRGIVIEKIPPFPDDLATQMLQDHIARVSCQIVVDSRGSLRKLVKELDCLPAAIELAGVHLCVDAQLSLDDSDFSSRAEEYLRSLREHDNFEAKSVLDPIWEKFELLLTRVDKEEARDAVNLLYLFAFLSSSGIPRDVLERAIDNRYQSRSQFEQSSNWTTLAATLFSLDGYQNRENATVLRKGIVEQRRMLWNKKKDSQSKRAYIGSLDDLADSYDHVVTRRLEAIDYRLESLEAYSGTCDGQHEEVIEATRRLARSYYLHGERPRALQLRFEIFTQLTGVQVESFSAESMREPLNESKLSAMSDLSDSLCSSGRWTQAMQMRRLVLDVREATLGSAHHDTLVAKANLSISLMKMGQHEEAVDLRVEVYELYLSMFGLKHPATLKAYCDLGQIEANINPLKGYAIQREALHEYSSLDGQGEFYREEKIRLMGQMASSLEGLMRKSPELRVFPESDYLPKGTVLGEAVKLRQNVYEYRKDDFGDVHPETLFAKSLLANSYMSGGKPIQAFEIREGILEQWDASVDTDRIAADIKYLATLRSWARNCDLLAKFWTPMGEDKFQLSQCEALASDVGESARSRSIENVPAHLSDHESRITRASDSDSEYGADEIELKSGYVRQAQEAWRKLLELHLHSGSGGPSYDMLRAKKDLGDSLLQFAGETPDESIAQWNEANQLWEEAWETLRQPQFLGPDHREVVALGERLRKLSPEDKEKIERWIAGATTADVPPVLQEEQQQDTLGEEPVERAQDDE